MRIEVHCPPGKGVGGDTSEFDLNTSKSTVGIDYRLIEEMRAWAADPGQKFHPDDPTILSLEDRVAMRNRRDVWPTCSHCGSEEHSIGNCPTRPRCPICNRVRCGGVNDIRECPQRPACDICGTRDHITQDHPSEPDEDDNGELPGEENITPSSEPSGVRVRPSTDGDLISTIIEGVDLVVRVNIQDPLYPNLRRAMDEMDE